MTRLNREQAEEFFKQVEGKRINWSDWSEDRDYFIPERMDCTLPSYYLLVGRVCGWDGEVKQVNVSWNVVNGFATDDHAGWIFVDEEEVAFEDIKPLMLSIDPLTKRKL